MGCVLAAGTLLAETQTVPLHVMMALITLNAISSYDRSGYRAAMSVGYIRLVTRLLFSKYGPYALEKGRHYCYMGPESSEQTDHPVFLAWSEWQL